MMTPASGHPSVAGVQQLVQPSWCGAAGEATSSKSRNKTVNLVSRNTQKEIRRKQNGYKTKSISILKAQIHSWHAIPNVYQACKSCVYAKYWCNAGCITKKVQDLCTSKPKNENMYVNDGTKKSSNRVNKSKHHITATNSQYVWAEDTSRRVYNRETLNGKNVQRMYAAHLHTSSKCSPDTNSLHTIEVSIMHYSMKFTAKELNIHA
jgi:hypothetical protein